MFGQNIPIKPIFTPRDTINVVSIFRTIQGEGPLAGEPAIFIRLAGCNLACHFCDTDFTTNAKARTYDAIIREVEFISNPNIALAVITGGEPMAQPIVPLIERLAAIDLFVQIETAGTIWQPGLEAQLLKERAAIVCSPKSATVHPMIQEFCDHYKYIIRAGETDATDGLPNFSTQVKDRPLKLYRPKREQEPEVTIWVQPCDEYDHASADAAHDMPRVKSNIQETVDVAMRFGHRVSFQMHKVLGVE
jgi:7-carboxy-7-deazaguanine synthase